MNNRQLSWRKYNNNHFIIASRAYFQQGDSLLREDIPEWGNSFVDDGHGGIDKVASLWTLRGWSPPWTCATVTLRGLKSPSTWMYDSTTYRNHDKNIRVSNCVWILQNPSLYILASCMLYFPLPIYSCMLAWYVLWMLNLCLIST